MSYIGNQPPDIGAYGVQSFDGGGTSFTLSKTSTTATVLLFIDGVRQTPVDAYSVSGVTLTTTGTTPAGTDNVTVQYLGDVVDFGEPSDDSVSTAKIQDDAVTAAKLANSINTEIAANTAKTGITSGQASAITANTAKVTNATHTGDVTGATALTIATDAVDIAMLSATGTADATTFLRGDNAWAAAGGGKGLQVVQTVKSDTFSTTSDSYVDVTGLAATITPSSASNKIVVSVKLIPSNSATSFFFRLFRGTTEIGSGDAAVGKETCFTMGYSGGASTGQGYYGLMQRGIEYLDTPATTSATTYKIQGRSYSTSNTTYVNRSAYDAGEFDGRGISTVTLWEIEG